MTPDPNPTVSAAHTPWFSDGTNEVLSVLAGGAVIVVAQVNPLAEVDDATEAAITRLIAAAPDLAEAGQELSEAIAGLAPYFDAPAVEHVEKWLRLDRAQKGWRAAISRATTHD